MLPRTRQRLMALSFLAGTSSVALLLGSYFAQTDNVALSDLFAVRPVATVGGVLGWMVMLVACAAVLVHPRPHETWLGRRAFAMEPMFQAESRAADLKALAVAAIALLSVVVCTLALTGHLSAFMEDCFFVK